MAGRTATERMLTPAPGGHRNGLPDREDYTYRGTGRSDPARDREWLADQLRGRGERQRAALATSREARAADAVPPPVIKLQATTDETGAQVFGQPEPRALPAPEPAPAPKQRAPRRCRRCGYLASKCGGRCR